MPAWSDTEGGSLNDEQIQQLVNFIMFGTDQDWADIVTIRLHTAGAEEEQRLAFVYHGAFQLQQHHRDVKRVSAKVLRAFYYLDIGTSNRRIDQLASQFENIQYGEVKWHNLPTDDRELKNKTDEDDDLGAPWELLIEDQSAKDLDDLDEIMVEVMRQPEEQP